MWEVPGSIPSQRRYKNDTSSSLVWHSTLKKGNTDSFSRIKMLMLIKNVMDKISDRNPSRSEVIGRCGGDEKTNDHAEPTNVER